MLCSKQVLPALTKHVHVLPAWLRALVCWLASLAVLVSCTNRVQSKCRSVHLSGHFDYGTKFAI